MANLTFWDISFLLNKLLCLFTPLLFFSIGCDNGIDEREEIDYKQEMRDFVINLGAYAENFNNDFVIIPQNGQEIITNNGKQNGSLAINYLDAIDGVGREDLLYGYDEDNIATSDYERDYMIDFLNLAKDNGVEVLVTDYCSSQQFIDNSYAKNEEMGYISFAANE